MDEKARKAEELLQERLKSRGPNGSGAGSDHAPSGEAMAGAAQAAASAPGGSTDPRVEELTNDLKRMTADFANYRKRNEAERAEFAKFAKADLIARLLDVLDGYDRALATVPDELRSQPWVEGMWLVERKLRQILESEGLEPIDSMGKPFDPYQHEAVAHIESSEPEGTVIDEHQKAYRLYDRVIRPALVTVAKKKES
ncbi:MAG TPA: nucleotide exchange factor GrpE [Candidatus Limnocylindria bacterium]|nr:nucleotide exchange factor GrpE [Candidatus Limnocylindria bacterium]